MMRQANDLCQRLKRLGFFQESQMRLYGQEFLLRSDPIINEDGAVFIDAVEKKSQEFRRVRIPLPIVHMAGAGISRRVPNAQEAA